jgi:hypothetical protein
MFYAFLQYLPANAGLYLQIRHDCLLQYHYFETEIVLIYSLRIKEDEMGGACSMHGRDENSIQNFGREIKEETT